MIDNFKEEIGQKKLNIKNIFFKHLEKIKDKTNDFTLIGDTIIKLLDEEVSLEIFCRCNKSETGGEELEFILNDVSRVKLKEKLSSEFKYKNLFLAKVAHEIKNPLISITELIEKITNLEEESKIYSERSRIERENREREMSLSPLEYFRKVREKGKNSIF